MVSVGSLCPSSMRETVEVGTPALAASARRESPALDRASRRTAALSDIGVAYTQPPIDFKFQNLELPEWIETTRTERIGMSWVSARFKLRQTWRTRVDMVLFHAFEMSFGCQCEPGENGPIGPQSTDLHRTIHRV